MDPDALLNTQSITDFQKIKKNEQNGESFCESVCQYLWLKYEEKQAPLCGKSTSFLEKEIHFGVKFLESQCTALYGFMSKTSQSELLLTSTLAIPNIFDTALITDVVLTSGITWSVSVAKCVESLLLNNVSNEGLWNFFPREYTIIPDEIDTSSAAAMALHLLGNKEIDLQKTAKNFLEKVTIYEDGIVDVYFDNALTPNNEQLTKWPVVKRVDLGATVNFLYLLSTANVEHETKLVGSYKMIADVLDKILEKDYTSPMLKYYKNIDLVSFFVSRLLSVSEIGKNLLKEKLAKLVKLRLLDKTDSCVSLACRIMAGINAGLLEDEASRDKILKEAGNLLGLQDKTEFWFPEVELYNANKMFYFGSKAMSTAFSVAALATLRKHSIFNSQEMGLK